MRGHHGLQKPLGTSFEGELEAWCLAQSAPPPQPCSSSQLQGRQITALGLGNTGQTSQQRVWAHKAALPKGQWQVLTVKHGHHKQQEKRISSRVSSRNPTAWLLHTPHVMLLMVLLTLKQRPPLEAHSAQHYSTDLLPQHTSVMALGRRS